MPEDTETDVEHVISHTNTARKKVQNMPSGICVCSEQLAGEEQQKADVLHSFSQALEKEEFQIYFQPKIEVKIDRRFLEGSLTENGRIVLQEIFHLLKHTKKNVVCEGVETRETAEFLIHAGCDELQGYYYYRPMAAGEFEKVTEKMHR